MLSIATVCVLICTQVVEAGRIRIWPTAVVSSREVQLRDVAELIGFDADAMVRLESVGISEFPSVGGESLVRVNDVREALAKSGVNMADVVVFGASRCRVTRFEPPREARATVLPKLGNNDRAPTRSRPALPNHKPIGARGAKGARVETALSDGEFVTDSRGEPDVAADSLESILRRHIVAGFSHEEGRVEIRFSPTSQRVLEQSVESDCRVRIRNRDGRRTGLVSYEVRIESSSASDVASLSRDIAPAAGVEAPRGDRGDEGAKASRELLVSAEVILLKAVVVARGPINQGQTITVRDVKLEERRFDGIEQIGLTDVAAVAGQQSRRFIRQGEMLDARAVESKPVIRRGEVVKIIISGGGVEIRTSGQAQASGAVGDVIAIRRDGSRRKQDLIDAVVVGPGLVSYAEARLMASREE
ncbi:MAG: flagellar basal body P-ring formation protein FlgA [Phycisphaerae bacterium]|nr:flagellar basal body P-ring formation protein FlgA [Phycisphaerae bacterium]